MLKHVAPIDPRASIPDPDHRNFLPPAGRTVPWTPYWSGLQARQEIVASDPEAAPSGEPAAEPASDAAAADAPPAGEAART